MEKIYFILMEFFIALRVNTNKIIIYLFIIKKEKLLKQVKGKE